MGLPSLSTFSVRSLEKLAKAGLLHARWLTLSPLLLSCSLAPVVAHNTIEYNATVEDATTSILIVNILRARDAAPLSFSDLSQIRGSIALNLSTQETFPFGPRLGSMTRDSAQAGPVAVNSTPGFDIAPLNTKKFYEGLLEPISPNILGYLLERGIDAPFLLRLLVSRIDQYGQADGHPRLIGSYRFTERPFKDLVGQWAGSELRTPRVRFASKDVPFGPPAEGKLSDLISAANANGLKVKTTDGRVQLIRTSKTPILCVYNGQGTGYAVGISQNSVLHGPGEVALPASDDSCNFASPRIAGSASKYVLTLRSVESVFYYLGGLLLMPDTGIGFHIYSTPSRSDRISVEYRGNWYYVRDTDEDKDVTITVLAVLTDLLNINRDADEIPSTKTVATTPGG